MVLERRKTRTIKNTTDTTSETQSLTSDALAFNLITTDSFFLGFHEKFASRFFQMNVVNTVPSVISINYFDGTDFSNSVEGIIDQTSGFTQSGFLSWINKSDWQATEQTGISDEDLFYVKLTVSVNLSATTSLQAVLNVFSDDNLLRAYYPDIVADTRFLPPSRNDFIEQHQAAKNLVVQRLLQKRIITDESQIIDINQVAIAAVHATAAIILAPISQSDQQQVLLTNARDEFDRELSRINFDVDANKDGILTESERDTLTTGSLIRV